MKHLDGAARRSGRTTLRWSGALVALAVVAAGCTKHPASTPSSSAASSVASAAPVTAAPAAAPTTRFEAPMYVVKQGDTIGKIASKLGVPVDQLIAANGLDKPDKITVGQKLRIPVTVAGGTTTTTTTG